MEENLAKASQKNIDVWANNEMEYRHRLEDLEREMKTVQLSRISTENRGLEQEVHNLMKKCQDKRVRSVVGFFCCFFRLHLFVIIYNHIYIYTQ